MPDAKSGASDSNPAGFIDTARYPVCDPAEPGARKLIARYRRTLSRAGALALPGFLLPEASAALAVEARALAPLAHTFEEEHTVYLEPPGPAFPPGHPRRRLLTSVKGGVAYDLIPPGSLLRRLYEWDGLVAFVAAILGETRLYRHADPLAALNINVFADGQGLNWHFDRADFAVTLSLQTAGEGGDFEYVPEIRGADDENASAVARVIGGERSGVRRLDFEPGALALFLGRNALHRVTPVRGPRARLVAVLSYAREPDVAFTPYARRLFYGRARPRAAAPHAN